MLSNIKTQTSPSVAGHGVPREGASSADAAIPSTMSYYNTNQNGGFGRTDTAQQQATEVRQ